MKKLLLYSSFFIFSSASAQTNVYHPFPDSGAVWNCNAYGPCGIWPVTFQYSYVMNGDTTIGNHTYHKLYIPYYTYFSNDSPCVFVRWVGYQGCVRQDTAARKVYFLSVADTADILLYDFTLQIGDSVQGFLTSDWCPATVVAIDYFQCTDGWRKQWHYDTDVGPQEVIEGIGSMNGLLERYCIVLAPHAGYSAEITCFSKNAQTIYPNLPVQCDIVDRQFELPTPQSELFLSPNPFTNQLTVSSMFSLENPSSGGRYAIKQMEIYNILGEKIYSTTLNKKQETINTESFPQGIYLVRVSAGSIVYNQKVVKK